MLSAVSSLIVEDLDKSLLPVRGITESQDIKPFTLLTEKTPKRWIPFASKQYKVHNFLITDVMVGNSDEITKIDIKIKNVPAYDKERELTVGVGGRVSLEIFKAFPTLKAEASASGAISVKFKTGGLTIRSVDEKAFEKEMRQRTMEKNHALTKRLSSRHRFCVITKVLETSQETVIECTSQHDSHAGFAAEVGTQGGTFNADIKSSKIGTLTLEAGTVLAFQCLGIDVDKKDWKVELNYRRKTEYYGFKKTRCGHSPKQDVEANEADEEANDAEDDSTKFEEEVNDGDKDSNKSGEDSTKIDEEVNDGNEDSNRSDEEVNDDDKDSNKSDEDVHNDDDDVYSTIYDNDDDDKSYSNPGESYEDVYNMLIATEDDIKKLKTAVGFVRKSSSDIEALLDLFEDDDSDVEVFRKHLQNIDEVWSLLELIGYKLQDDRIELTYDGPFHHLIPSLIAAISMFDTKDLDYISKCDSYQRKEILRIIEADSRGLTCIPVDPQFTQELQKEPVENVMALMNYEIDFLKGELSPRSNKSSTNILLKYLLNCL